jgi:hypothetical protein
MRRWGYHLSAAAAVLALAACSPSEETNMTDTEESGVTDTADLPGAQLNVAIQAETESLEWLEDVEGERALAFATEMNEQSLDRLTSDPRYDTLYNQALEVLQSTDRIPMWASAAASCGISGRTPTTSKACGARPQSRATPPIILNGMWCSISTRWAKPKAITGSGAAPIAWRPITRAA